MNSLLRADLSRVFKHKSVVYTMFIVLLVIALLYAVFVPIMQDFVRNSAETASEIGSQRGFGTPLSYAITALLLFGNIGFLTCWACTSVAWADARSGYDRTIISSVGKRVYYREKFILAAIVSAVFTVGITLIGGIAAGIVSGYTEFGSVIGFIEWICLVAIATWAFTCLSLTVLWYFRNSTIAYITGFVICTGLLSSVLGMVFGNISPDAAETWTNLCKWLPTGCYSALQSTVDGAPNFEAENLLRIVAAPVVCLFVSYHLAFHNLTKRDL